MREHERKRYEQLAAIVDRINAGARELRRLGAGDQHDGAPRWAYAAFSMAAVFDTVAVNVAVNVEDMPRVLLGDALRACEHLLEPLPGDRADGRARRALDQS
ncbi:hypothetical protein Psed_4338 [Pseudonocardia dioxanivorans CB1190]|uniref:Uncharacterized protein n=1 Tax=Pseudonocardia dioxanivorans (strain ATCC 55486 / DSM 44775 / JCM 13855 / CB1190) TaxID=675635 RepID=F4CXC3_PSEUX|nr:hypothetical protein [Pseudonocardia dioxanivorans]AEA26497.1 hypothetical protein Psed_4338 [Pseudonocardia dioxanivorans CB1190]